VAAPSFHTELTGNHLPPSFVPIPFFDFSDRMTFSERLLNGAANLFFKLLFQLYLEPLMSAVYREHLGADMPSYQQIHRNVSLIFMNSHFALTYPRPNFPDNVEVGGMHCRPAQPLPKVCGQGNNGPFVF
jgi:glucuronosyltransferase